MPTEPEVDRLILAADLERLIDVRVWVRGHAQESGFADRALTEIELAVTEAVSNVMRHGLLLDADQTLTVEASVVPGRLQIVVCDRGPAFDPIEAPEPDLSEPQPGGYGIHLIRTVMDDVSWCRTDGENRLTMIRGGQAGRAG